MQKIISAEGLHKYYNRHTRHENHVFAGVTISFESTGLVCLLGESGSGKTTLINVLGGLDRFSKGSVTVSDSARLTGNLNAEAERIRNESYGYIFQSYFLLNDKSVAYNLKLALCRSGLNEDEIDQRIDYVLDAVDMLRYKKRLVSQLSGGQAQRVAIARALIKTPAVIFADEPTGNLDEANTLRVMSILKKISETCLVILATHEKNIAEFFADRIISLRDGNVVEDRLCLQKRVYHSFDDHNIYLDEYKETRLVQENVLVEAYAKEASPGHISLTIVRENGRIYVKPHHNEYVEVIGQESDTHIIDGKRPDLDIEKVGGVQYHLKKIRSDVNSTLSFKDVCRMAANGVERMGKKLALLALVLLATAVLSMYAVADYQTLAATPVQNFITSDSRLLQVSTERAGYTDWTIYDKLFLDMLETFENCGIEHELYTEFSLEPSYHYEGFIQMEGLSETFFDFKILPLHYTNESQLILGRMPEKTGEILVDKWLLENFIANENIIAASITDIDHFIGKELAFGKKTMPFIIAGVVDSGNPTFYVNKVEGLGVCIFGTPVTTLENLKNTIPGAYDDITLTKTQALVDAFQPGAKLDGMTFNTSAGLQFETVGALEEEHGLSVRFVVSEDAYEDIKSNLIFRVKKFVILTEDREGMKQVIANLSDEIKAGMRVSVIDLYGDQLAAYKAAQAVKLDTRLLVTGMILLMSIIALFVVMKSNAESDIMAIGVYRLMGIKKRTIALVYLIQIGSISLYTTLLGALATAGVLWFVSGASTINAGFVLTVGAFISTVLGLLIINIGVTLLPVFAILNIPLAQISARSEY